MAQYGTLYDLSISGRGAGRKAFETEAVKNQRNVGALQINHPTSDDKKKPRTGADQPTQGIGPWADGDRYGSALENIKGGTKGIGPVKDGGKYAKSLQGGLTASKIGTIANAAGSVLNALDMLTGGQDTIIPGSGYAMQHAGYNPEMYIGRGMGY